MCDLNTIGIRPEEDVVHEKFQEGVKVENDRYDVRLPWKEPHPTLPDNCDLCLERLKGKVARRRKDPELLDEYNKLIRKQFKSVIVGQISRNEHVTSASSTASASPRH